MTKGRPFIPEHERRHGQQGGLQLPYGHLLDRSDPHYYSISVHLEKLRRAGVEIDQTAADNAAKLIHWEHLNKTGATEEQEQERRAHAAEQANWQDPKRNVSLKPGIVYYILRQRLIKIGTTIRPLQRFADLMPDAILAAEPGGEDLERKRHREFRAVRSPAAKGEYFLAVPALVDHIRALREEHGVPAYKFRSMISGEESEALVAELLAI